MLNFLNFSFSIHKYAKIERQESLFNLHFLWEKTVEQKSRMLLNIENLSLQIRFNFSGKPLLTLAKKYDKYSIWQRDSTSTVNHNSEPFLKGTVSREFIPHICPP